MSRAVRRTDTEVKSSIVAELKFTPNVDSAHIGVAVTDGAVTLSGEVDSYPEKVAAEHAVQHLRGVHGIAQEIQVRGDYTGVSDTDIAREASEAIAKTISIPPEAVHVTVHEHIVTLTGTVPWNYQRAAAVRAVHFLRGVMDVQEQILIKAPVSTVNLKNSIAQALVRNARVDARQCVVTADDAGNVTLEGDVHTWSERLQAEQIAWAASGVNSVRNLMQVTS